MRIGLPSVRAWAVFFLALCISLQTVPLETPILSPASSWESPSRSTSLRASSSASSIWMGSGFPWGVGVNLSVVGTFPILTGLGNLPLLPCLRLCFHPIFNHLLVCSPQLLYISVLYSIIECVHNHKNGGELKKCQEETERDPGVWDLEPEGQPAIALVILSRDLWIPYLDLAEAMAEDVVEDSVDDAVDGGWITRHNIHTLIHPRWFQ